MELQPKLIHSPELFGDFWFNGGPVSIRALRGYVVLVDFWDYSCINCLRTLPYLTEWHNRYRESGLMVVGVHTPEFGFGKNPDHLQKAIPRLGIPYPVVADNEAFIWSAFATRAWPTKFLIDKDGFIRFVHRGEGGYDQFERAIQALLVEAGGRIELPDLMAPVRSTDAPGAMCFRPTAEVQGGYLWGALGNSEGYSPESTVEYSDKGIYLSGRLYAEGKWIQDKESIRFNGDPGETGRLTLRYEAARVNAVVNTASGKPVRVEVTQDGQPLTPANAGDALQLPDSSLLAGEPRMYELVKNPDFGEHLLQLSTSDPGFQLYAFSFVTSVMPEFAQQS